ncbi:hypothetical protein IQ254_18140 [Nodosilinea sp. LEGE 07088]|uniref:hypothetical protein n=1 Tax=Nodosilinea sp. LEGE 07088 TaxID=2777968 RepID=UPI0018821D61|nr:hypothetical protein [Nodosilinea sp. LEGE 07088]MBE9139090.1 hypothetical protein [Nodosilinea sp. LEGE 07088]
MLGQISPRLMAVGVMALGWVSPLTSVTASPAQSSPSLLGPLAQVTRWVEVSGVSGRVAYRGRERRSARVGDRLTVGQGLGTARRATASDCPPKSTTGCA